MSGGEWRWKEVMIRGRSNCKTTFSLSFVSISFVIWVKHTSSSLYFDTFLANVAFVIYPELLIFSFPEF